MGVRIPIEIKKNNKIVKTSALANTGYETDEPEIHIPIALARKTSLTFEALKSERYRVVGTEITTYTLGYVEVRLAIEKGS